MLNPCSYRREGYILADAVQDLYNLREFILTHRYTFKSDTGQEEDSSPRVVLYGESMGGPIMTLAIERHPDLYSGVLGLGAAMWIRDDPPGVLLFD
jgi:pimeloyl-ACP methyl ester carboxylesterase